MRQELETLIKAGHVRIGDELFHPLRRLGGGQVTARIVQGGVEVGGTRHPSLSTAAKEVSGSPANGWTYWRHRRTGRPMDELRKEAAVG